MYELCLFNTTLDDNLPGLFPVLQGRTINFSPLLRCPRFLVKGPSERGSNHRSLERPLDLTTHSHPGPPQSACVFSCMEPQIITYLEITLEK